MPEGAKKDAFGCCNRSWFFNAFTLFFPAEATAAPAA